jgi:hypothetical protein
VTTGSGDFVDGNGQDWDVKRPHSRAQEVAPPAFGQSPSWPVIAVGRGAEPRPRCRLPDGRENPGADTGETSRPSAPIACRGPCGLRGLVERRVTRRAGGLGRKGVGNDEGLGSPHNLKPRLPRLRQRRPLGAAWRAPAGTRTPAAFPGHDRLHEPSSGAPARVGLDARCDPGAHVRRHLPFAVGVLLMPLGCPSEYGRAGRVDQAMGDDLRQPLQPCPAGKHRLAPPDSCFGDSCEPKCVDDDPDAGP